MPREQVHRPVLVRPLKSNDLVHLVSEPGVHAKPMSDELYSGSNREIVSRVLSSRAFNERDSASGFYHHRVPRTAGYIFIGQVPA